MTNTRLRAQSRPRSTEGSTAEPIPLPGDERGYRTLRVLAAMRELDALQGERPHQLNDIAGAVKLPLATVCRILQAAEELGLVTKPARGFYSASGLRPADADPIEDDDDDNVLLRRLHDSAQVPALLFAPALLFGATTRVLVQRIYGRRATQIGLAPTRARAALHQAPLRADAAGLTILAQLVEDDSELPAAWRPIREAAFAIGPAPIWGMAMLAAPIWRGSAVSGCIALMPPAEVLRADDELARLTQLVVTAAHNYSRRTTAAAADGDGLSLDSAC